MKRKYKKKCYEVPVWQVGVEDAPHWATTFIEEERLSLLPTSEERPYEVAVMVKNKDRSEIATLGDFIVKEALNELKVVRAEHFYYLYEEIY